jgi:hypothetical protein
MMRRAADAALICRSRILSALGDSHSWILCFPSSGPNVFIVGVYTMVADLQQDDRAEFRAAKPVHKSGARCFLWANEGRPTERVYWVNQPLTMLD